jgi:hypothetical protein
MSYTLIERKELTSTASSISFDNIPQFYTDLVVLVSGRGTRAGFDRDDFFIKFNSVASGYSARLLQGNGASAASAADSSQAQITRMSMPAATATANTFGNATIYIPNYAGSTNKSVSIDSVTENNGTTAYQQIIAGIMANTEAISSITIVPEVSTIAAGSSISLYGINRQQAIGAPKAIGGAISFVNGYWVHSFTGSGTFYANEDIECQYLVVAGGGGGGLSYGGGGGAGGYRSSVFGEFSGANSSLETTFPVKSGKGYSVVVGSGGAPNVNGSNSAFDSITAIGGGMGGRYGINASSGGSGGGGGTAEGSMAQSLGGAGTSNQGFAGGNGIVNLNLPAGGGGGASSVGVNATSSAGGNGGSGLASTVTGSRVLRAGGGGGSMYYATGGGNATPGTGGSGGGGTGGTMVPLVGATSATANTGSGGGGGNATIAGNGGSGIVIIRYKA